MATSRVTDDWTGTRSVCSVTVGWPAATVLAVMRLVTVVPTVISGRRST